MNPYRRVYTARIAPCSEDWRDAIYRGAPVADDGQVWTESFAPSAFINTGKPTPILIAHEDKPVGEVVVRTSHNGWHICDFRLDPAKSLSAYAVDLLRVGAPVSIGARSLRRDKLLEQEGVRRHLVAILDEISILRPGERPGYPGAQVIATWELPNTTPAAGQSSDRPVAGDTVIPVVTDEETERMFDERDAALIAEGIHSREGRAALVELGLLEVGELAA